MTRNDKHFLRWLIRHYPSLTAAQLAEKVRCTLQTAQRYRRAAGLGRKPPKGK